MSNKTQKYEIRDVIHGLIERSSLEVKIINTPVFQRLRRIRQLALAHLVYPGAHHTRFEHCLGTMHIAGRISEKLKEDDHLFG
jgi:HD superfamily phosphohydrolase